MYRVLYLAMSPDGEAIVTGAGDETLRFWNVFSKARSQKVKSKILYKRAYNYIFSLFSGGQICLEFVYQHSLAQVYVKKDPSC